MEEKTDKSKKKPISVGTVPEDNDPVMDEIAARLREFLKDLPPRQVRSVGWGWWDKLQGRDPDESDFYESEIRSLSDLFDDIIQEMEEKSYDAGQVIKRGVCSRSGR